MSTTTTRAALQRDLAAFSLVERQLDECNQEIARVERTKDDAANRHQEATGPIQSRLAAIEERIVDCFAAKREPDKKVYAERAELLQQLSAANDELALAVAAADTRLRTLRGEHTQIAIRLAGKPNLQFEIRRTAPRELLERVDVVKSAVRWAQQRAKVAGKKAGEYESSLDESRRRGRKDEIEFHEEKVRAWRAEQDDAERDAATRQGELDELLRRALED